jgi:hypothetical protein
MKNAKGFLMSREGILLEEEHICISISARIINEKIQISSLF